MGPVDALAVVGTLCGPCYFVMGIFAGSQLRDTDSARSPGKRLILTNFLWSLSPDDFLEEGYRLCRKANFVAATAAVAWLSWAILK
jgi:hypothetical protein